MTILEIDLTWSLRIRVYYLHVQKFPSYNQCAMSYLESIKKFVFALVPQLLHDFLVPGLGRHEFDLGWTGPSYITSVGSWTDSLPLFIALKRRSRLWELIQILLVVILFWLEFLSWYGFLLTHPYHRTCPMVFVNNFISVIVNGGRGCRPSVRAIVERRKMIALPRILKDAPTFRYDHLHFNLKLQGCF